MNSKEEEQNKRASQWIDSIIQDLTDPSKTLEDCLRKTLVLAYTLQNDSLKDWVDSELNSYPQETDVPNYRRVNVEVRGNIAKATFGGIFTRKNSSLYFEGSAHPYFKELSEGFKLRSNVASLESISQKEGSETTNALAFQVAAYLYGSLEKLYDGWKVEEAWIQISAFAITELLSRIKTRLLQFLLEINSSINSNHDYSIMTNSDQVNQLVKEKIGYINAENVTFGNNYQVKGNDNNISQGENVSQLINETEDIKRVINDLILKVEEVSEQIDSLKIEDRKGISNQVVVLRDQLDRQKPNVTILSNALSIIENILVSVTANVYQPGILEAIARVASQIQQ